MAYGPPAPHYPPRAPYGPPPRRSGLPPALLAVVIAVPVVLVLGVVAVLLPDDGPTSVVTPRPVVTRTFVTAWSVADDLARLYPLPHVRDNTHACAPECRGLVTTDAVSVYEFADEAGAKRWVRGVTPSKVRRVGRWVLSFVGIEQGRTPVEARDKMAAGVKRLTG